MDNKISEKIATSIILSMFNNSEKWKPGKDEDGHFTSDGVIQVSVDAKEILCLSPKNSEWNVLDLETNDIERVQDVAYDMVNDPLWMKGNAFTIGVAIKHLGVTSH